VTESKKGAMRSVTIIILHAFVVSGLAKDSELDNMSEAQVDRLGNKLFDRMLEASSLHHENLDDTTVAKTQPSAGSALSAAARAQTIASLPGPSALKARVISAIQDTNGRCMAARDISVKGEKEDAQAWIQSFKDKQGIVTPSSGPGAPPTSSLSKEQVMAMPGVSAPLGFFDPLAISTTVSEGRLLFYREAELKHGRVCMIAILGLIVGENHAFIPLLGNGIPSDTPAYLLATPYVQDTPVAQFWPTALFALFVEEWRRAAIVGTDATTLTQSGAPGDYGWDPLGLKPKDAKALYELQTKELNNGRLAMFATAGWIAQEQLTGKNLFFHG
jgi:hypothetical protein